MTRITKEQAIEILNATKMSRPPGFPHWSDGADAYFEALASAGAFTDGAAKAARFEVTTYAVGPDGTRSRQIDGFSDATVIVRGERSAEVTQAIVERFSLKGEPRKPIGPGGCVRIDERGIWLLNRADRGWSSSAIHYDSWRELFNDWDFQLGNPKTDVTGIYWPVESRPS